MAAVTREVPMQTAMRIPELSQRDRFIRCVVANKGVWAVAGEDGLVRVASPSDPTRQVTLFWTSEAEARRWADVLTAHPRVKMIPSNEFIGEVLPKLSELGRLVGVDWSAEPIEVEIEAMDLASRLRQEGVESFLQRARLSRSVWMLEDADGPAVLVSQDRSGQLVLPCWASAPEAEARIEGPWSEMLAIEIPLANFVAVTLPWLADQGWKVAPGHNLGADTIEINPAELSRRIEPEALAQSA
ncbi:MAG: DUF2750 domain-containing protein [Hyphomicrobiaceae bacterium]|nr:DUF2750 domain-containing protein [Hyphomicrobiaceae bacterium]